MPHFKDSKGIRESRLSHKVNYPINIKISSIVWVAIYLYGPQVTSL